MGAAGHIAGLASHLGVAAVVHIGLGHPVLAAVHIGPGQVVAVDRNRLDQIGL